MRLLVPYMFLSNSVSGALSILHQPVLAFFPPFFFFSVVASGLASLLCIINILFLRSLLLAVEDMWLAEYQTVLLFVGSTESCWRNEEKKMTKPKCLHQHIPIIFVELLTGKCKLKKASKQNFHRGKKKYVKCPILVNSSRKALQDNYWGMAVLYSVLTASLGRGVHQNSTQSLCIYTESI